MYKDINSPDAADWKVIDADTEEDIPDVCRADDMTGEYEVILGTWNESKTMFEVLVDDSGNIRTESKKGHIKLVKRYDKDKVL